MANTASLTTDVASFDGSAQPSRTWAKSHGMYIAGRALIDEADKTAIECEQRWGAGRLRLLVDVEWREKFDRQRYLFNQAIWHGDLEAVKRESARMVSAWRKLDSLATQAGHGRLDPTVWEVCLSDGSVAAIVQDASAAHHVVANDRRVQVYTLEEIGRLLDGYPAIAKVKATFPGATVTAIRQRISDPLDTIEDSKALLDDEIPY